MNDKPAPTPPVPTEMGGGEGNLDTPSVPATVPQGTGEQGERLTIFEAQSNQPWTVPYSRETHAAERHLPHILATHCALHAAKTVGKLAAVFEALDHVGCPTPTPAQLTTIEDMSADLFTEALRFANLYNFDLEAALLRRRAEKNKP